MIKFFVERCHAVIHDRKRIIKVSRIVFGESHRLLRVSRISIHIAAINLILINAQVYLHVENRYSNSTMAKKLSSAATFLDSHSKRDKVIRTVQFGALLVGGLSKNRWPLVSQKLLKVYNEFGHARLILRMIDDVPMLAHTLRCCFSREVT